MRMKDPSGNVREIVYIPNCDGFGAHAYVRVGLFRKIESFAAGDNAVDNLVEKLERMGWRRLSDAD